MFRIFGRGHKHTPEACRAERPSENRSSDRQTGPGEPHPLDPVEDNFAHGRFRRGPDLAGTNGQRFVNHLAHRIVRKAVEQVIQQGLSPEELQALDQGQLAQYLHDHPDVTHVHVDFPDAPTSDPLLESVINGTLSQYTKDHPTAPAVLNLPKVPDLPKAKGGENNAFFQAVSNGTLSQYLQKHPDAGGPSTGDDGGLLAAASNGTLAQYFKDHPEAGSPTTDTSDNAQMMQAIANGTLADYNQQHGGTGIDALTQQFYQSIADGTVNDFAKAHPDFQIPDGAPGAGE